MMLQTRARRLPRQLWWAGFLLTAASILLVLVPFAEGARSAGVRALLPVADAASSVSGAANRKWQSAFESESLAFDNEELRAQVAQLLAEKAELESRIGEFDQETLLSQQLPGYAPRTLAARVIAPVFNGRVRRLWIEAGENAGITAGQAVLGPSGIVGVIRETFDDYSIVELLTDQNSKWGGEVKSRGERGMATGTGSDRLLRFQLEKTTTHIESGDEVVTSGMKGSIAPAGILLGRVVEVTVDEAGQRHAVVETDPIDSLRFVYVLNATQLPWEPPK